MEKYTKVRVLGKGSFGSAILIKRRSDNALLVIKEVFLGKMSRKEREEARHECRVLQQLNHPNIVRYIEHFENRNNLYIVMEYCDGGDLHGKLKSTGPMKEKTILYYYSQVCLAMEYLHSRHILHRDIKTMNVFLMKNGSVKLGDFGISTVLRNTMGMANTVCGTPYYFSPEICRNKPYNNKSDVWALGVLLYELATGRHPFDGNSMQQLMQRIVKGTYPALPSHFSPEFCKMVDWCLQKNPASRPSIKQSLSLPIVRRSLEQLEENLMLATQCKVRLRDIMDFEVGSNGDNNKQRGAENKRSSSSPPKQQEKQRPLSSEQAGPVGRPSRSPSSSPRPAGFSPGRAAALAVAEQQQQPSPRRQVPLGPKPAAAGIAGTPAIDHNRIDNYRRHLQQQYQQRGAASPAQAGNNVCNSLRPASPAPRQQQQRRQQQQQQQEEKENQRVVQGGDPRNIPVGEQLKRVNEGEKGRDVFKERMQRVDAIMQRYAQNVDPKARETIHAYMKRKQEEYAERQKIQQDRAKRRAELRRQELAKVIEYQNRIARGDAHHNQQQRVGHQKSSASPSHGMADALPYSPRKQQQQQQQQHAAFGRDPRYVRKLSRELEPSPPSRKSNQNSNDVNALNGRRIPQRARQREKVVAANSPRILAPPRTRQNPTEMSPRNGGARDAQAAAAAAAAAAAKNAYLRNKNLNNNINKNDLKLVPPPPPPGSGRSCLPLPPRGKKGSDINVTLQQQQQKPQAMLHIISTPVVLNPTPGGNGNFAGDKNIEVKRTDKILVSNRPSPNILVRHGSAPLHHPAEVPRAQNGTSFKSLPVLGAKHMIRPTAAAGFMPQGLAKQEPQQQQQLPGQSRSPTSPQVTPSSKSPVSFISRDDIPAAVEVRRRLEQQQIGKFVPLTEVKLQVEYRSGEADIVLNNHSPRSGVEEKNVITNNNKKRLNNPTGEMEGKVQFPPSTSGAISSDNNSDDRPQAKSIPPLLSLGPLQVRQVQIVHPQNMSPLHISSPQKPVNGPTLPFARVTVKEPFSRSSSNSSKVPSSLQPTSGIMPSVVGLKVAPQVRTSTSAVAVTGARRESFDAENEIAGEPPVLVDVEYGVCASHQGDSVKQTTPVTSTSISSLPLLAAGDGAADPPDVAQKWRNVLEKNGSHKVSHRVPISQEQGAVIHESFVLNENDDVLVAYQKPSVVPEMMRMKMLILVEENTLVYH
ncbi:Protein kinase domain [Trypanosoma melophagium]|uniref:Protein kinase domain n=1 Tax=Trypanosoma melophagium TaxID=715481 RepID=UPI003519F9B6|nr:Protein kinase domain [Trypanosoma melophagium]